MTEANFTDITIIANSSSKPPRKEGKDRDGVDQFIITFSLSNSAKGPWIETFNRAWGERSKKIPSLRLPVVSDDRIQITCPLDDQLQGHLDDLKREVVQLTSCFENIFGKSRMKPIEMMRFYRTSGSDRRGGGKGRK